MGCSSSSHYSEGELLRALYLHYKKQHNVPVVGGNETSGGLSYTGGYSALEDYGNSVFSKAKEDLIRGIAKDVSGTLGFKGVETGSIDGIIKKFKEVLPKPGVGKGTLKADAGKHAKLCQLLAKAINRRYDMDVIDVNAEPHIICQKVAELMYSLFTGLHTEFLHVAGDVSRIIKNLEVLQGIVDSANQKILNDLANSNDGQASSDADNSKELYKKISEEIRRQHVMLSNLVNSSIGPVGSSLVGILEDNDSFTGLVEDLKKSTGTQMFGDKISLLMSGISDVSHSALLVDKALKNIGMSLQEYKSSQNLGDLRTKVYDHIASKNPSSEEMHKMLVAADIIYRNDLAHDDIAAYLSKKGSSEFVGGNIITDSSFADMVDDSTWKDDTETPFKGRNQSYRKSIGKQLREQTKYRNMLFGDFNLQLRNHYVRIIDGIGRLAKKVGVEIKTSLKLEKFIRLLNAFAGTHPDKKNLHIALSGYRTDPLSNFTKFQYLDYLHAIKEECDGLSSENSLFKEISNSITQLITLVDAFTTNFTKTLSDIHIEEGPRLQKKGGDEFSEQDSGENSIVQGGQISEILGGIIANVDGAKFKHFVMLKRVIREMDYYFRIANIKTNLRKTSIENQANISNYENILGEEGGNLIDQIQKKYNVLLASADGGAIPVASGLKYVKDAYLLGYAENALNTATVMFDSTLKDDIGGSRIAANDTGKQKYLDGYKFLLEYIRSAKIEMIEVAQSLDLYLSQFTIILENDPDTIKNFVQIIENLEITAKWFTEKSGDHFTGVFESFAYKSNHGSPIAGAPVAIGQINNLDYSLPAAVDAAANSDSKFRNPLSSNAPWKSSDHYYEDVKAGGDSKDGVGMFYKPRLMTREEVIEFVKQIEKSIKGVMALENIINLFTKVNTSTSGNIKTFMSNGMMFKALMKYCVASVISIGYKLVQRSDESAGIAISNIPNEPPVVDFNAVGGDINDNKMSRVLIKAGVGLRFSNDYIRLGAGHASDKLLRLCDPLELKHDIRYGSITDKLFEMCIKSIISKIFVVIGSYSLFNKPPKNNNLFTSINGSFSINPLRQIMGGNHEGGREIVNVNPEATELYMRLPLLAEWYRTVFEFNNGDAQNPAKNYKQQGDPIISIIPEMDNIWRDLCKVIFIESAGIEDGAYPSEYAHRIIKSINEIYLHYKAKKRDITCKEIMEEFVLEVNRRYGFMKRDEIKKYLEERTKMFNIDNSEYDDDDRVNYDLLGAENQYGKKMAPSDKFRSFNITKTSSREELQMFYNAVRRFRHSIEQNLMLTNIGDSKNQFDIDMSLSGDISMDEIVRITQKKMENAKTPEDRYKIVHSQLHGVDKFNNIDQNKLLVLHETVINPLTLLYFTYLILNDYNKFMVSMNLEKYEDVIQAYVDGGIDAHGCNTVTHIICAAGAGDLTSAAAAAAAAGANNEAGNIHAWLAIKLLEFNNKRFKANSAKEFGFGDDKSYIGHNPEGIHNIEEMITYFTHGDAGSPYAAGTNLFGLETKDYIVGGAELKLDNVLNALRYDTGSERLAILQRFCINRSKLMEDTLRKVMNLACELNGMVDVYFPGESKIQHPTLNFDKLEEICTNMFQQAKQSLSKLRKFLPVSLIERFEKISTTNAAGAKETNAVSLFYLQEHLFDRLFKNKYGNGLNDGNVGLKNIWNELTREHKFNYIQEIAAGANYSLPRYHAYKVVRGIISAPAADTHGVVYKVFDSDRELEVNNGAQNDFWRYKDVPINAPGTFPIGAQELKQNVKLDESLNQEYCYDSYGDVLSKLLFWDNSKARNVIFEELGFRLINETSEGANFPAHYNPIFTGGDSIANVKNKDIRDIINNITTAHEEDVKKYTKLINSINKKAALFVNRGDNYAPPVAPGPGLGPGVAAVPATLNYYSIIVGVKNMYDYNVEYSDQTELKGEADATGFGESLGGTDKVAPHIGGRNVLNAREKFGLISKLNNILYTFMSIFIDPSNKKIYKPLIDKFVNGYNSKDILLGKNINERPICNTTFANKTPITSDIIVDGKVLSNAAAGASVASNFDEFRSAICLLEPPEQAVIFSSLANAIKTVLTGNADRSTGTVPLFVEENFANISEYQKELMRAYLPIFEKQLSLLTKRAEFLKQVIEQTRCKVYKYNRLCGDNVGANPPSNIWAAATGALDEVKLQCNEQKYTDLSYTQPLRIPKIEAESARKTYLLGMISDITATAKSLQNCIIGVQKELADVPLFFETYKDSIVDYNNRNGKLPLMPISIVSHLMNFNLHRCNKNGTLRLTDDTTYDIKEEKDSKYHMNLFANLNSGVGTAAFKFAYGTRGFLNPKQKPSIDYIPGMSYVLDYEKLGAGAGSKTGGASAQFDKISVQSLVESSIMLSRFITDYFYHAQFLDKQSYNLVRKLIVDNQKALGVKAKNMSCQTGKFAVKDDIGTYWGSAQNIIMSVENDNIRQSVYRLISCLRSGESNVLYEQDRPKMRIYNILDMNLVPINVHSMQREIPFINLMNYSHTFDQLVKETFGIALKKENILKIHGLPPNDNIDRIDTHLNSYNNNHMELTYRNTEFNNTQYPEDQLVRQLIYPNGFRRLREYVNHTYKIMAGDTSMSLNRPKFLSDQLWNKVLLNTLYDTNQYGQAGLVESRRTAELEQVRGAESPKIIADNIITSIYNDGAWVNTAATAVYTDVNAAIVELYTTISKAYATPAAAYEILQMIPNLITNNGTYPANAITNELKIAFGGIVPTSTGIAIAGFTTAAAIETLYNAGVSADEQLAADGEGETSLGKFIIDYLVISTQFGVVAGRTAALEAYGYNALGIAAVDAKSNAAAGGPITDNDAKIVLNNICEYIGVAAHAVAAELIVASSAYEFKINTHAGFTIEMLKKDYGECEDLQKDWIRNRLYCNGGQITAACLSIPVFNGIAGRPEEKDILSNYPFVRNVLESFRPNAIRDALAVARRPGADYTRDITYTVFRSLHMQNNMLGLGSVNKNNADVRTALGAGAIADVTDGKTLRDLKSCTRGYANNGEVVTDAKIPLIALMNLTAANGNFTDIGAVNAANTHLSTFGNPDDILLSLYITPPAALLQGLSGLAGYAAAAPVHNGDGPDVADAYPVPAGALVAGAVNLVNLTTVALNSMALSNITGIQYAVFNQKFRPVQITGAPAGIIDDTTEPLISGLLTAGLKDFQNPLNIPIVRNLSYINDKGEIKEVYSSAAQSSILHRLGLEGYLRYNTKYIRWTEWIVQLQRVIRILMRQQLEWVQDPVVREHDALAEGTTEFGPDNRGYMLADFE